MRPVVLPLASGHRRVAARTAVKTCTRGATCNEKNQREKLSFALKRLRREIQPLPSAAPLQTPGHVHVRVI